MWFKRLLIAGAALTLTGSALAAEWTAEPALSLSSLYNDNIDTRGSNEQSSTGYTLAPKLLLRGRELNWNMGMDALIKATRYSEVDNADSDNYFFNMNGGYATERHDFRLTGSFSRNTTYDTDYETELAVAGAVYDHTEQETTAVSTSWRWQASETLLMTLGVSDNDIEYDEVSSGNYISYTLQNAVFGTDWEFSRRSRIGFRIGYDRYESDEVPFQQLGDDYRNFTEYEKYVYQLTYLYKLSERSSLDLVMGTRKIDSTLHDVPLDCAVPNPISPASCLVYNIGDTENSDDGVEANIEYSHANETSSITAIASRMVSPSIYGGAQEHKGLSIQYGRNMSERLSAGLIVDAREIRSIADADPRNDYRRYRFEPRLTWKLKKDWLLSFSYRYINLERLQTDDDGDSNIIYVNLSMAWPRLASTY